ncbi:MAG: hypothetical protein ACREBD_20445 [Blastocatellia bacterium]
MIKALSYLTTRDKQALAVFFGIALMCSLYFASGILVTYVSQPAGAMEVAKNGNGFTVRVLGLQTFAAAQQLSAALQDQRGVPTEIEAAPASQGYLLKVGPLVKRSDAETLTNDLHNSGYSLVRIAQDCPPGTGDCNQSRQSTAEPASSPTPDPASKAREQ